MDILVLCVVAVVALLAGVLAGWAFGLARAGARGDADRARWTARAVAAEASAEQLRQQLAMLRADQAAREDRERREQHVLRALAPVEEALRSMQRKVDGLERDRHAQFGAVAEQLRRSLEAGEALRSTTASLAGALRSGATRGVWGETQLRRVVEAAGLTRHVDFDLQQAIVSDAGVGRPDMVVRLPGGAAIAVDAKVPLAAYLEASAIVPTPDGSDADHRRSLMTRHSKAVRAHVDALAKKAYWAGIGSSPEFVICFLPSESLLAAALDEDPSLLDHAFSQRVALASPVNLWAVLKTVAFSWSQQDVSEQAHRLVELGTQLHSRLSALAGHADALRRAIERTVDSYNGLVGSLESRVLVTARKFPGIDPTALAAPVTIDRAPRMVTAPELRDTTVDADQSGDSAAAVLHADLGELRGRLIDDEPASPAPPTRAPGAPA